MKLQKFVITKTCKGGGQEAEKDHHQSAPELQEQGCVGLSREEGARAGLCCCTDHGCRGMDDVSLPDVLEVSQRDHG